MESVSPEPNHPLAAQRKARAERLSQLEQGVKPTSSTSSSNNYSSYVSPALQSSQELPPPKTTRSSPKTTQPPHKTTRPSANGTQNSKRRKKGPDTDPQASKKEWSLLMLDDPLLKAKIFKHADVPNKYLLRKWIDKNKLHWRYLSINPNSISFFDALFEKDQKRFSLDNEVNIESNIPWNQLSENPNAIELLRKRIAHVKQHKLITTGSKQINWWRLSKNPNAIELLEERIKEENALRKKTYKRLLLPDKINWDELCKHPNAIKLLKENIPKITKSIFANKNIDEEIITTLLTKRAEFQDAWDIPKAIQFLTKDKTLQDILKDENISWNELSRNTSSEAIELLKAKAEEEKNIRSEDLKYSTTKYSDLSDTKWIINWAFVSSNPNAIELLKTKAEEEKNIRSNDFFNTTTKYSDLKDTERINWVFVSSNPNAFELLKTKAVEEKLRNETLSQYQQEIPRTTLINWDVVSSNPNAIALLETKILDEKKMSPDIFNVAMANARFRFVHWNKLSSNPKAIALLTAKAKEEKQLITDDFNRYKLTASGFKIDWDEVSSNPKAIKLLTAKAKEEKQVRDVAVANKTSVLLSKNERINWDKLSSNTKAIALLETKIKEEIQEKKDGARVVVYYNCKIDPEKLSANPKAVKLLEKYPDYISIKVLCSNPNAVKLIKKQVLLERDLSEEEYTDLPENEKINWEMLSMNPCIFYETSLIKTALGPRQSQYYLK